jgi:hypothetical protein
MEKESVKKQRKTYQLHRANLHERKRYEICRVSMARKKKRIPSPLKGGGFEEDDWHENLEQGRRFFRWLGF